MTPGNLFSFLKIIFISIFFLIVFFGKPSLERYLEKSTVFVDEKDDYDIHNPPVILIYRGTKTAKKLMEPCLNGTYEAAIHCIENALPNNGQIFLEGEVTTHPQESFKPISPGSWRMDFDNQLWLGKRYFLEKYQLEPIEWLQLSFINETTVIEFIDPKFYFRSYKYQTVPKFAFYVQPGKHAYLEIVSENFHLLNRPSKPCINSVNYSLTKCVEVRCIKQNQYIFIIIYI